MKQFFRIINLNNWLSDAKIANRNELLEICDRIIHRDSLRKMILHILNNPDDEDFNYASVSAYNLNMEVTELIFNSIKQNPIKHSCYLSYVCNNPEYANQLIKIYEEILPLDDLASGMGDLLFAESLSQEHRCLEFILDELKNYPLMGEKLVLTALKSPVVRERIIACRVLEEWCEKLNQNLKEISPELFTVLKEIVDIEIDADTRENMKKLLI